MIRECSILVIDKFESFSDFRIKIRQLLYNQPENEKLRYHKLILAQSTQVFLT